jgi:hypothetical protein
MGQDEAEAFLRAFAQRFGGDPAATDSTRVFRLPGFANKKYQDDFQVTLTAIAPANQIYHASDFGTRSPVEERENRASTTRPTPRSDPQS